MDKALVWKLRDWDSSPSPVANLAEFRAVLSSSCSSFSPSVACFLYKVLWNLPMKRLWYLVCMFSLKEKGCLFSIRQQEAYLLGEFFYPFLHRPGHLNYLIKMFSVSSNMTGDVVRQEAFMPSRQYDPVGAYQILSCLSNTTWESVWLYQTLACLMGNHAQELFGYTAYIQALDILSNQGSSTTWTVQLSRINVFPETLAPYTNTISLKVFETNCLMTLVPTCYSRHLHNINLGQTLGVLL